MKAIGIAIIAFLLGCVVTTAFHNYESNTEAELNKTSEQIHSTRTELLHSYASFLDAIRGEDTICVRDYADLIDIINCEKSEIDSLNIKFEALSSVQ